ncbi:hypothetical protein [Streptomyces abyssomicinicus]|nr:hypothetical protein [Streptomyces abyssomicinicus]
MNRVITVLIGTVVVGLVAVSHPPLIPAMGVALVASGVLLAALKP